MMEGLPAPTPEMYGWLTELTVTRLQHVSKLDKTGGKWCRKFLVGRIRKTLAKPTAPNVVNLFDHLPANRDAVVARDALREILRAFCKNCGQCELGRE